MADSIGVTRLIEEQNSLSQCTSHFSLPPLISVTQQPTSNNFVRVLGPSLKVDQIANDIVSRPIQQLANPEAQAHHGKRPQLFMIKDHVPFTQLDTG